MKPIVPPIHASPELQILAPLLIVTQILLTSKLRTFGILIMSPKLDKNMEVPFVTRIVCDWYTIHQNLYRISHHW